MNIASRLSGVAPSLTLAIDAKAKAMKAKGMDLCNFTVGEPDFDTPAHICEAAKKALDTGKTKYGATAGEIKLREAISQKLKKENGLDYAPDQIVISNGGKHSLFNTIFSLIETGDEVLIPSPYWLSYPEMVRLAVGTPVFIPTSTSTNFKITPELLKKHITKKSKILILNSPSNPTGMVYSRAELAALVPIILENNLYVISDEIYEKLIYDGINTSIGALGSEILARTITINGFAKAYAMTGWRLGYMAGPKKIADAVANIQSHCTSNVCSFAQYGAIAALEQPESQSSIASMYKVFKERRELIYNLVKPIEGISCLKPDGAFYLFIDISKTGLGSLAFCEKLLENKLVAAVPGLAFGMDSHIRISYATSNSVIEKGSQRLKEFVAELL